MTHRGLIRADGTGIAPLNVLYLGNRGRIDTARFLTGDAHQPYRSGLRKSYFMEFSRANISLIVIFSPMDSVSQALWGGMSSVASSRDTNVRQTFVWGAIGGTLPDLDAWLGALVGPVQERIWHRGPSHSLVLLGAIGALVLWRHRTRATAISARVKHVWVGAFTPPFLDLLTGFETGWGIPLVEPSALGWCPVGEPVLLCLLMTTSVWCLVKGTRRV